MGPNKSTFQPKTLGYLGETLGYVCQMFNLELELPCHCYSFIYAVDQSYRRYQCHFCTKGELCKVCSRLYASKSGNVGKVREVLLYGPLREHSLML